MARHRPFPGLAELFNTKAKDKLQSYQLIDALIMDLHRSINDGAHSALAVDLTRSTFNFQDIHLLKGPSFINSEQFLLTYTHCLTSQTTIDFSAEPFGFQNLPGALAGPWLLAPLAGPNTACLRPPAVENFNPEDRRFILLWYNNHSQRSDVCLYILDLRLNTIFAWPTYGFWIYQDLLHTFQLILDMPLWIAPQARATHFRKLPTASQWNHLAAPCPIHFGHYLQNNLGHLSRLEDLGILASINTIYRTHTFDYFLPEEEQLFMSESTRPKLIVVPNDREAVQLSTAQSQALIVSKSAAFGSSLSSNFRRSILPPILEPMAALWVCVGVRGGTRMCLNLVDFVITFAAELNRISGRPVELVIDGMSRSTLNNKDTTAGLSTSHEQAIADEIIAKAASLSSVSARSVVGLTTFEQLSQICRCSLAVSGFGTQYFKYVYLCNLPTIVHGVKEPDDYLNVGITPVHLFLGQDSVASIEETNDHMRNHYNLKIALSTARAVLFAEQTGALAAEPAPV